VNIAKKNLPILKEHTITEKNPNALIAEKNYLKNQKKKFIFVSSVT
jgi:hypothetical protein